MAKPTSSRDPAILCAERIAALHFLHHIPVLPSSNPVTTAQNRSAGYILSFEKERDLAGTLAFLAFLKDDTNHIPAVCVEQGPDASYLNVLLAVNKLNYDGGRQVLEELKASFDGVFSLLDQDYDVSLSHIERDVFKAIVSMCHRRILHRLRLQGRHIAQKLSIKEALLIAFTYLKNTEPWKKRNDGLSHTLNMFVEKARDVLRLADSWAKHRTVAELESLVNAIRCLRQVNRLEELIREIPDNIMASNLRDSLINMISKVSRYREAARFLYRIGKKVPLARKMRAVIVQWPETAFAKSTSSSYAPSLNATVSLVEGLKNRENDLERICHMLNNNEKVLIRRLTSQKASDQFAAQSRKTLREAKIHAEIQLLYYCDKNIPHNRLPRVVCSSKDACWLCNEFIALYQKMHTPKSHGRIYPGWRLPAAENDDLAKRYNQRLQDNLKNSLKKLFQRKERTAYPPPNESTLLALYLSDSTLSTVNLPLVKDDKGKAVQEIIKEVAILAEKPSSRELVLDNSKEYMGEVEEVEVVDMAEGTKTADAVPEIEETDKVPENAGDEEMICDSMEELDDIYDSALDAWCQTRGMGVEGSQELQDIQEARELGEGKEVAEIGEVRCAGEVEVEEMVSTEPIDRRESSHDARIPSERWSSGFSSSSSDGSLTLEFGKVKSRKIWMGKSTSLYNAGPLLNLQVKYAKSKNPETSEYLHKKLSYSLERLRPEDVAKLRDKGVVPIAGADLPTRWVGNNTDEEGCVYISNGDAVMKLFLRPVLE